MKKKIIKYVFITLCTAGALAIIFMLWKKLTMGFADYPRHIRCISTFVGIILTLVVGTVWFALLESTNVHNKHKET